VLKKIEAIIREDKVNDVREALNDIGIVGMNMFEVRGHGRQEEFTGRTRRNIPSQHASQNTNQYRFERKKTLTLLWKRFSNLLTRARRRRHYFCYACGGCHSSPHARAGTECNDVSG